MADTDVISSVQATHRTWASQRPSHWWVRWAVEFLVLAASTIAACAGLAVVVRASGWLFIFAWGLLVAMNLLFLWTTAGQLVRHEVIVRSDGVDFHWRRFSVWRRNVFVPFGQLDEVGVTRHGHIELRARGQLVAVVPRPAAAKEVASAIAQARRSYRETQC